MEENDVKGTCGGTRFEFMIEKDEKVSIYILSRFENFFWKTDQTKNFFFQNLAQCVFFNSKSHTYWNFQYKVIVFKMARKLQNMSF